MRSVVTWIHFVPDRPEPMRHFDPQSLALFIAVCDQGSIAAAAEQMAIVPSAISKRMTALEDQVGVRLLIRRKRFR